MHKIRILLAVLGLLGLQAARADLNIEITKGVEGAIPIAVVPFAVPGGGSPPEQMAAIVSADLARSGYFKTLPESAMAERPGAPDQVKFSAWQSLGQEYLVVGRLEPRGEGYSTQFYLLDVFKGGQVVAYTMPVASGPRLRRVAHQIADLIFKALTGKEGAFDSRISYVTVSRQGNQQSFELQIADSDGARPQTVLRSREPILSPSWSPDGSKVAYVSYERRTPAIIVQNLATAERQVVSSYPGINGAPAWSPDGRKLALTLSRDGNPEIYVLELGSRGLQRLTRSNAIDTEPVWSRDGQSIIFTSDRGGNPQLYRIPAGGGNATRLTFEGNYNARPRISPDGRLLAMVRGGEGGYRIAVMDLETRQTRVLTEGSLDESPSFAPNGAMILYTSKAGGNAHLAAVSVDGRVRQKLSIDLGEVREPAWSP